MGINYEDIWEVVDGQTKASSVHMVGRTNQVYLTGRYKKVGDNEGDTQYNKIHITKDLIEKLGWKIGDRVTIYHSRTTGIYKIQREKTGLNTLTSTNTSLKEKAGICISGIYPAASLLPKINGNEFEAWTVNDAVVFKPMRKEG